MIIEDDPARSVWMNGDPLETLAGLSFPGMDEIRTKTAPDAIEWLTLHTVQYAIRKNGRGGMAELFACGPADLTPAECLKMVRICALHGVTRYFTVMSAMDASWMDEMHGFTTTIGDQQPWFAEFPAFLDAADEASGWAAKRAVFDVAVRFPRRQLALANMKSARVPPVNALIRELECAQIGVELVREEDSTSASVVFSFDGTNIVEERTGRTFASPKEASELAIVRVPERFVLREADGTRAKFDETYAESKAFALSAGEHEFRLADGKRDGSWFLPAAFLAGGFAERGGRLLPCPRNVAAGSLASVGLAGYCGRATWKKAVDVPAGGDVRLVLETGGHFARVKLGGCDLGAVGWGDFSWKVPEGLRGRNMELEISVYTSLLPLFGSPEPPDGVKYKGATKARACGILAPPEWLVDE